MLRSAAVQIDRVQFCAASEVCPHHHFPSSLFRPKLNDDRCRFPLPLPLSSSLPSSLRLLVLPSVMLAAVSAAVDHATDGSDRQGTRRIVPMQPVASARKELEA